MKLLLAILLISYCTYAQGMTYYVNSNIGDNNFSGASPDSAWKDLTNVNVKTFEPGDSLLFAANAFWVGSLTPKGSGTVEAPIVIDRYGEGKDPLFIGFGIKHVLYLYNQEYITIRNLEITNSNVNNERQMYRGIYILGEDIGTLHNIKLQNLYIHNVTGSLRPGNTTKENGGIYYEILGNKVESKFDSLIIEGCRIIDVDRVGISNKSSWWVRTLTTNTSWYPSTNIVIRNNYVERSGGNGLIIRDAQSPLIEYNVFKKCGLKVNGNAMFTFNCDDALVQYNEASETVYNEGDVDASGFDGDFRCKRTLFQYNYSHDNDGGFMVVVCLGGPTRFNDSCVVRYNISQNDGGKIFHISGQTTNTFIYNNTIYMGGNREAYAADHSSWNSWPDSTFYFNNIFINTDSLHGEFKFNSSTNNFFDNNIYYGFNSEFIPLDSNRIIENPRLVNSGIATSIDDLDGYKLESNSPAINSGLILPNISGQDFFGNPVPFDVSLPDIGAHEYQGNPTSIKIKENTLKKFGLYQNYPNPFNPTTTIKYEIPEVDKNFASDTNVSLKAFDILGREIATLVNERKVPGIYEVNFDARSFSSGAYYYTINFNGNTQTKNMILAK